MALTIPFDPTSTTTNTPLPTTVVNPLVAPKITTPTTQKAPTAPTTPSTGVLSGISKNAQDISKAQGVAYEGIAKDATDTGVPTWGTFDAATASQKVQDTATPKTGSSYIDNATNTVAGQLNTLLKSDSPYIQLAQTKAKEQAAGRGLLNSSMAAGAGQRAAIESALPIAQQDAETYSKFGLQQQQAENLTATNLAEGIISEQITNQQATNQQLTQNIQNAFNAKLAGANEQSKVYLQELQGQWQKTNQELVGEQNLQLQQFAVQADVAKDVKAQTSKIIGDYNIAIENILTDPDILDLGGDAVQAAIALETTIAKNNLKFIGAAAGLKDFGKLIDTYIIAPTVNQAALTEPPATTTTTTTTSAT